MKCSQIFNSLRRSPAYVAVLLATAFLFGCSASPQSARAVAMASLTPDQRALAKAQAAQVQEEMAALAKQMAKLIKQYGDPSKPMSAKNLASFGAKFLPLTAKGLLLTNRMMAMSQGHLLLSDHPKVKPPGPSIHELAHEIAKVQWQQFLLYHQQMFSPPKTAKAKADLAARLRAVKAKLAFLGGALTSVQQARYKPMNKEQKQNMFAAAAKFAGKVASIPGKITPAAYGTLANASFRVMAAAMDNNSHHARVKGEVVDPSGKPLKGVEMVVEKSVLRGLDPDKITRYTKIINGHFDVSASGFHYLDLHFYKKSWRKVEISVGSGFSASTTDDNASINVPFKRKGHTWTVRVVLPAPFPGISLDDYDGQLSEGPNGHGDAITMSVPSTTRRLQLKNVDLTKPKKLPPYTFYVTFKCDAKGRVLMKKYIQKYNNVVHEIPQEIVLHLTGKNAGLHVRWDDYMSGENGPIKYAFKGPYQNRIVVTSKDILAYPGLRGFYFDIKMGGRYGYSRLSFTHDGWQVSKNNKVITLEDIDLSIQSKDYHTRFYYPY